MKVYKFGGASVKDAAGIKNLSDIVSREPGNMVVVVSAFGKTTNALEAVLKSWLNEEKEYLNLLDIIYEQHASVADDLFSEDKEVLSIIKNSFNGLKTYFSNGGKGRYDFEYDQIVSYGELWSTIIVSGYLQKKVSGVEWIDIRKHLITDERHRDANVLWSETTINIQKIIDFKETRIFVTQGFIGGTRDGSTTTLGREGSDYTAAIIGNIMEAESVVVWKDVPGVLNADPKWYRDARKLDEMSYKEAVEMTFSGAKVIHPKTIKPLHNKSIPLYVRSFLSPGDEGTIISADPVIRKTLPVYIKKEDQILLSLLPVDFSFVMGDNLSMIFNFFITHGIKVNLVEASAVSLDVCVDDERLKVNELIEDLKPEFSTIYNENVEMLSVRHYDQDSLKKVTGGREILLEQRTRSTVRFVVRKA
ncbi:MAG TPA: aspartate kinase [Bacteroidales bacterium]|nr:aspartate kinase [Bacteroidales bacterium]